MDSPTVLTAAETAPYLRLNKNTLSKWRGAGCGPAFVRAGRRVLYRLADLENGLEAQREAPATPVIPANEDSPHA